MDPTLKRPSRGDHIWNAPTAGVSSTLPQWNDTKIIKGKDITYCLLWPGCLGNVVWKRASLRRRREHILILTWQTSWWLMSRATSPVLAARFSPLWLGKLESAFLHHFWWQLGFWARGSKWRDTLNGLVHNTDPDTKILQHFERPKADKKKKKKEDIKEGTGETRQSWLIPPTLPSI